MRRRDLLRLSAMGATASLLGACLPQQSTPPGASPAETAASTSRDTVGGIPLGKIEGAEVVADPAKWPRSFKEAPELAALVRQGRLPPVAERIGQDPLVLRPVHGIGKYGGELRRAYLGPTDATAFRFAAGPDGLLYTDHRGTRVIPNIARAFEFSPDGRVLTIQMRRGMKWSDGAPLTADDVMFWYEDMYLNKSIVPAPSLTLTINGKPVVIEKLDQLTLRFVSSEPNYLLPERLNTGGDLSGQSDRGSAGFGGIAPKHYLSKFHPKYTPQAEVDRLAAEGKFPGWPALLKARNDWQDNPDLPVLTPWKTVVPITNTSKFVLERNPYSIWIDTEGNQLPYIGTLTHAFASNLEVVSLRATSGELDFQDRHLEVAKLPIFIQGQQRGAYKIHLDPGQSGLGIALNLAYEADPEVGEWLRNVDFRRALSLGIDRDQINETFFLGTGTPGSAAPPDDNKYSPGPEWRTKWATLDVARANELLDKIGLTQRDAGGYRLRKDGKPLRLDFQAAVRLADFPAIGEMLKEQWKKIGIDLIVLNVQTTLLFERINANLVQMTGNNTGTEDLFLSPDTMVPGGRGFSGIMGIPFARWRATGGKEGREPFAEVKQAMDLLAKGYAVPEPERLELGKELTRLHLDNVFSIGLIGRSLASYGVRLAKTGLGNVPERIVNSGVVKTTLNAHPMTFYYK